MKVFIVLLLIFFKYSQLQEITTLFNCTYNDGLTEDCIFPGLIPIDDSLEIDAGQVLNVNDIDPPSRPVSDATSVCM